MAITTLDGYIAAPKQRLKINKTASRAAIALIPFGIFDLAGNVGAGVLAGTNTANGLVPTDATVGTPPINAFGGGSTGYLTGVDFSSSVACQIRLFDLLFKAGAYTFNANVTLSAQPSYASRVPSGTDFSGTELWIEAVTAFTGLQTITVTYTNQAGVTGRTTGAIATAVAPTVGRMLMLPLQAGDSGVQKIESVVSSVSTVGTFNVLVLRSLWAGRVKIANDGDIHDQFKTGAPVVFADSAIVAVITPDSTATGLPRIEAVIADG